MTYTWNDVEQLYENGGFCPEGWVGISSNTNGDWRLCCYTSSVGGTIRDTGLIDHINHPDRCKVRLSMIQNDEDHLRSICRKCYYQEDNGLLSRRDRVMMNFRHDERTKAGVLAVMNSMDQDGRIEPSYIHQLDIKFIGNQCNLKCFTCGPKSSSSLGVEGKALGELPQDYHPVQIPLSDVSAEMNEKFWDDFRRILPSVRVLNFTGGEPFMMNAYWDMIDMAIDSGLASQMELHLSSNVSAIKWNRGNIMDCFRAFQRVRLQASIDGYQEYNDYIRYPSQFDILIGNIERIRDTIPDTEIVVSSVVSALSVKSIKDLHEFVIARGFQHTYSNVLESPRYQRTEYLPEGVKQQYRDIYEGDERFQDIHRLLDKPENLDHHRAVLNRLRALDKHRGTDACQLWPEFLWD